MLLEEGEENKGLVDLWETLPRQEGGEGRPVEFNATTLMPRKKLYYYYQGSLTTPPCTEGVRWFVMRNTVQLSADQIEHFADVIRFNARPTQKLNGREITVSRR